MTDHRSPFDQVLDLVVFAPLGLAVTLAEELPQMADKGRARMAQRTAAARMVGQLAVAEGRRRFGAGGGSTFPTAPPPAAHTRPAAPDAHRVATSEDGSAVPSGEDLTAPAAAPVEPATPAEPAGPVPTSQELAIPGYDSLSASQVVQRLASLSEEELAEVRAYETAHRGRRTILARVAQLQHG